MANRFDFEFNADGKVIAVTDTLNGKMLFGRGSEANSNMRHDDASWTLPAGAGAPMPAAATPAPAAPQPITSAKQAQEAAMRRAGHRGWTAPAAPSCAPALVRFDAAAPATSKAPRPAGMIGSAAEARAIMQRRGNG